MKQKLNKSKSVPILRAGKACSLWRHECYIKPMTQPARRPSLLAPALALVVAIGTVVWGLRSTSGFMITQAIFGTADASSSVEVRALVVVFALAIMEVVLALALWLGHWRPGALNGLGLFLVAFGVILGQLMTEGPFWALALLGAYLAWEAFSMRVER